MRISVWKVDEPLAVTAVNIFPDWVNVECRNGADSMDIALPTVVWTTIATSVLAAIYGHEHLVILVDGDPDVVPIVPF